MNPDTAATPLTLDIHIVNRLKTVLQDQFAVIVDTAITNITSHDARMQAALKTDDFATVQNNAHSIVSSAGVFGMLQLVTAARALEYYDVQAPVASWRHLYLEFQACLTTSLAMLQSLREGVAQ